MNREYSNRGSNIEVNPQDFHIETTAVIAGITKEDGMLINECYKRSVDTDRFIEFLQLLKKRLPKRRVALFMDNLSVHRCGRSLDEMSRLGFVAIFNTAYSPEHNPIEMIFSKVKHYFKAIKTNAIVNRQNEETKALIKRSFVNVTKGDVANCI